jgi:maltose O-acetyltransferase
MLHTFIRRLRKRLGLPPSMEERIKELRSYGMLIGEGCYIDALAEIEEAWASHITFGAEVSVAPGVRFISHDASMQRSLGITRVGVIDVGSRAFIGANSIVMPNVRIGADTIIAAGSVVTRDIPAGVVAAGNPARVIKKTADLQEKTRAKLAQIPCFGEEYRMNCGGTVAMRKSMLKAMPNGECFIVKTAL